MKFGSDWEEVSLGYVPVLIEGPGWCPRSEANVEWDDPLRDRSVQRLVLERDLQALFNPVFV